MKIQDASDMLLIHHFGVSV